MIKSTTLDGINFTAETLAEKLRENERLMEEMTMPWKEKLEIVIYYLHRIPILINSN